MTTLNLLLTRRPQQCLVHSWFRNQNSMSWLRFPCNCNRCSSYQCVVEFWTTKHLYCRSSSLDILFEMVSPISSCAYYRAIGHSLLRPIVQWWVDSRFGCFQNWIFITEIRSRGRTEESIKEQLEVLLRLCSLSIHTWKDYKYSPTKLAYRCSVCCRVCH